MTTLAQKKHAPATERNKKHILKVLTDCLPEQGTVLEVASGTGQHGVYFIEHLPHHFWQPSDPDDANRKSIRAWWWDTQLNNMLTPLDLDAQEEHWPVEGADLPMPITAIVCINMIHISPWEATIGLMKGARRILPEDGILYLYGPYKIDNQHTSPSNEMFDLSLRSQNPGWGVRDMGAVVALAAEHGLTLVKTIAMPANNQSVIFRKAAS